LKRAAHIVVLTLSLAIIGSAQGGGPPGDKGKDKQGHADRWKHPGDKKPGQWLRKYKDLPADQQEQKLKEEPDFQKLPADRQQKLIDRLRRFNQYPPEQREKMISRMERFEQLSPEQRERLMGFHRQLKTLPPDRQKEVRHAFRHLHTMTPEQRQQYYASDKFKASFNEQEQQLVRNLAESDIDEPAAKKE
jgi:hypothetical protein